MQSINVMKLNDTGESQAQRVSLHSLYPSQPQFVD